MKRIIAGLVTITVFANFACIADNDGAESNEPATLSQARKAFQGEVNTALMPIKKKYLQRLEDIKKQLGGKGDIKGASIVQKEIEKIKDNDNADNPNTGDDNSSKKNTLSIIPGTWEVSYSNGSIRTYVIDKDGYVEFVNENRKGTITEEKGYLLVDLKDGKLETWKKKSSNTYSIDHYVTSRIVDGMKPNVTAIAKLLKKAPEQDIKSH